MSGWKGTVISTQWVFSRWSFVAASRLESYRIITDDHADVFDGTMITLAMFTLNLFHPGIFLRNIDYLTPSSSSSEGASLEDRFKTTPPLMKEA